MSTFWWAHGHEHGFDWNASPPWVHLTEDWRTTVALVDGANLRLVMTDPAVCHAEFLRIGSGDPRVRLVGLHALRPGSCQIHADLNNHIHARLDVRVSRRRSVGVNFYRVRDHQGNAPFFNASQVRSLLFKLNTVYPPQTGIVFHSHLVRQDPLEIDIDFATPNQDAAHQRRIWHALDRKRLALDSSHHNLSVFWVKTWGARDQVDVCKHKMIRNVIGTAGDHIGSHLLVMEDMASWRDQQLLVSHELGHCLRAPHDETHRAALMYPTLVGGDYIFKPTVEHVRGR